MASVKAKFLDLEGLKQFWNSVKTTQGANIVLAGYTKEGNTGEITAADTIVKAIAKLDNKIADVVSGSVSSFGGQTGAITVDDAASSNGSVHFTMSGKKLTGTVDLSGKADLEHTHTLSQITDLNNGWDSLLAAAPDVVTNAQLDKKANKTEVVSSFGEKTGAITLPNQFTNGDVRFAMMDNKLTGRVVGIGSAAYQKDTYFAKASHEHTLSQISDLNEGWDGLLAAAPDVVNNAALAAKADKTEALKSLSGSAANNSTDTVITINGSMADGSGSMSPVTIKLPKATSANYGTISENKVIELAQSLVSKLDGSLIFKGTVNGTGSNLPAADYKAGWTYLVAAEGTYAGQTCENGDMIVCVKDYATEAADGDWAVIQTNINGAVTHSAALVKNGVVIGADGNGGVKTVPVGKEGSYLRYSTDRGVYWEEMRIPNAGEDYGLVKSNTKVMFLNGEAISITADKVANALTIKGLTTGGVLDTGDTFNGLAAVEFDAITFSEINSIFA